MKNLIKYSVIILLTIVLNETLISQNDYMKNRFTIGAYNKVMNLELRRPEDLLNYNNLNFNVNLSFTYRGDDNENWRYLDGFITDPSEYLSTFQNTINDLFYSQSDFNKQKIYFERAKIIRGALGQRSTYQAENHGTYQTKFPGYGYNYSQTGMDYIDDPDNNVTVAGRRCISGNHSAGYMVYGLYENMEQVDHPKRDGSGKTSMEYFWSDNKDDLYFWVVKPRMRIKESDFNDPNKKEMNVVRIDIVGYLYPLDPIYIKVKDFGDYFQNYNGEYKEDFYTYITEFNFTPILQVLAINLLKNMPDFDNSNKDAILQASQVDYKVYWCGNVDVWLDYVRVDDEWAHFLFTDPTGNATGNDLDFHQKINDEVNALNPPGNPTAGFGYFYVDEYCYNNVPCIAEVNRLVQNLNPNTGVVAMDNEFAIDGLDELRNKPYFGKFYDDLLTSGAVTDILVNECYPFDLLNGADKHFVKYPKTAETNFPAGLAAYVSGLYRQADNDEEYNDGINYKLEQNYPYYFLGIHRKSADMIRKARQIGKNITYSISIQNHVFEQYLGRGWADEYGLRDVTNEEVRLQSYLALTYGAKQIMDYCYHSDPPVVRTESPYNGTYFNNGLITSDGNIITTNYYGQPKFQFLCNLNAKLRQIGEIMYPTDQPDKHLILNDSRTINTVFQNYHTEYTCGLPFKFISDILSIYPDPNGSFLDNNTDPSEKRYWEVGTFLPPSSIFEEKFSKYFIMLNKRCTPPKENVSYGDVRHLKIKFDPNDLPGFNNWVLIDPLTNNVITAINKNSGTYYYAGEFQPGEGKLFKLAPVMQEGGTFVCDEEVLGQTFVCKGSVFTSHYNLEINNSHIEFLPSVSIQAGYSEDYDNELSITNTQLNGKNSVNWHGISGNYLYNVFMSNIQVSDIEGWAVNLSNCDALYLQSSTFNLSNTNSGAVALNNSIGAPTAIIWNNAFVTKSFTAAIAIFNSSGSEDYVTIYNNNISTVENGNNGIIITNSSGEIEDNTITGFSTGINLLTCAFDVKDNNLSSGRDNSIGINATAYSTLNLSSLGNVIFGGYNGINNYGTNCVNINVDNSSFASDIGYNEFNVNNTDGNYNFFGTGVFPKSEEFNVYEIPSRYNCFNGVNGTPRCSLRVPNHPIIYTLIGNPYYCNSEQNEDMFFTVQLAENFVDTVFRASDSLDAKLTERQKLYKGVLINFRKHQYDSVSIKGSYYLSNYTDSVVAPDIISKLFYSASTLDTAGEKIQPLKTYFEQLIINNPNNPRLVKSAYYHIQKCKVYLEQYQSALAGFEDIIAQNPYGYEGLLASWDYAATLLLMDTIGAGGMSNKLELNEYLSETSTADFTVDSLRSKRLTKYDNYDKSVFTPNDRKIIIQNTATIFAEQRNKQIEKVKELEKKVNNSDGVDATRSKTELATMKALNEVVKIKRAKDQPDYMRLVTEDVNKVFKNTSDAGSNKTGIIPTSFELHQNYPNPFNPSTKIAFDLPKDAKVKLVIYDILGREIKTLIHNEFRTAGKYITEFNGSNLASGVYFYRLQANDFVSVKKMLMIK